MSAQGTSIAGNPQPHYESGETASRKCPAIGNIFSRAQPQHDRHNNARQQELAMEDRFPTRSFPFRFFTTVLGIIFVNTQRLHIGTNLGLGNTTYKEHLSELFFDRPDAQCCTLFCPPAPDCG